MIDDRMDLLLRRLDVAVEPDPAFVDASLAQVLPAVHAARRTDASPIGRLWTLMAGLAGEGRGNRTSIGDRRVLVLATLALLIGLLGLAVAASGLLRRAPLAELPGAWTMCVTEAELLAAGDDPAAARGNFGCTTLEFADGAFRERGASAATEASGRYEVDGRTLLVTRDGGDEAFDFTATIDGDTLTLAPGPIGVSPIPWTAKPFQRDSTGVATASTGPDASGGSPSSLPAYVDPLGAVMVGLDGTIGPSIGLPETAWSPVLSPDGMGVAFVADGTLFTCAVPCDAALEVPLEIVGGAVVHPRWSPDGTRIAFSAGGDLFVVEPGSGAPARRLTAAPGDDEWPAWSPDGRWIYYTNQGPAERPPDGFPDTQEVWRVAASGGAPERMTENVFADSVPDVGPDGTVLFGQPRQVWAMGPEGEGPHRLPVVGDDAGMAPRISPDGTKLALLRLDPTALAHVDPAVHGWTDTLLWEVVIVDLETGAITGTGVRVPTFDNAPSWNRAGDALLVNGYDARP